MVPIVTQVATDFSGRALVGTVDVNAQSALSATYGVSRVPTFVFFRAGHEVSRVVGTMSYEDLSGKLLALLASP